MFDLINALTEALKRAPEEVLHEIIKEEFTVEQKIHDVLHLLLEQPVIMLRDVFSRARSIRSPIARFAGRGRM